LSLTEKFQNIFNSHTNTSSVRNFGIKHDKLSAVFLPHNSVIFADGKLHFWKITAFWDIVTCNLAEED
jgi:hypothetical protein